MRSSCGFPAGASRRSTFTTTVCGASFSKSWMPIETCSLKSRMKRRRSEGGAISFLLVKGDVTRPPGEVLAAVDNQHIASVARRRHDKTQGPHEIFCGDADAQRVLPVLLGKARIGLAAAAHGEARRDARHAQARRKGLRQQARQALQADLAERIAQEIRI